MGGLRHLAQAVTSEEIVRKSRFITRLFPVADAATAKEHLNAVRRRDHAARHHASALVIGTDAAVQRSNDDGEPAGTAGLPMLEVLRRERVTDILAVSTRYFGGILLGRGGLIRAYGGGVSAALALAEFWVDEPSLHLTVTVPAAQGGRAENLLRDWAARAEGVGIGQVVYGEQTELALSLPPERLTELEAKLAQAGLAVTLGRTTMAR
ncbi:MAG: YigZ family protein [Bifidobacteriaceae bacterium]|jgi:uncharacterized YigZ family protein|nr:YigZ family protein [Bifidobacteriaceae bacterium]